MFQLSGFYCKPASPKTWSSASTCRSGPSGLFAPHVLSPKDTSASDGLELQGIGCLGFMQFGVTS